MNSANRHRLATLLFFVLFICITVVACSRLTQENFNQIKPGMTTKDVIVILGEPTHSDSVNIAGISGTNSVWEDQNTEIDIQFLNDKVLAKTFSKDKNQKMKQPTNE